MTIIGHNFLCGNIIHVVLTFHHTLTSKYKKIPLKEKQEDHSMIASDASYLRHNDFSAQIIFCFFFSITKMVYPIETIKNEKNISCKKLPSLKATVHDFFMELFRTHTLHDNRSESIVLSLYHK